MPTSMKFLVLRRKVSPHKYEVPWHKCTECSLSSVNSLTHLKCPLQIFSPRANLGVGTVVGFTIAHVQLSVAMSAGNG